MHSDVQEIFSLHLLVFSFDSCSTALVWYLTSHYLDPFQILNLCEGAINKILDNPGSKKSTWL